MHYAPHAGTQLQIPYTHTRTHIDGYTLMYKQTHTDNKLPYRHTLTNTHTHIQRQTHSQIQPG